MSTTRWTNVPMTLASPDYWRFDAMAAYKVNRNLTLQLNVYNLLNEVYYESLPAPATPSPGPAAMSR